MLRIRFAITSALIALALTAAVAPASAKMKSTKLSPGLCLTEGGGKFVDIPGFPGEMIDRRLLRDVKLLERRYKIFVTDGYSTSGVHSPNGEHPLGLALDIAPNSAKGGTWSEIDALAAWAEPQQNQPIAPFRWVGYDGDANHGRGHHLHLSWSHSPSESGKPAGSVYTIRCPRKGASRGQSGDGDPGGPSGGTKPGEPNPEDPAGGIRPRLASPVAESGGVGL